MASSQATELRNSAYGWLGAASQVMQVSKATASRDFALVRRIDRQFLRMVGRSLIRRWIELCGHGLGLIVPIALIQSHRVC